MQNLLIVGAGDVARRALPRLLGHYRLFVLLRDPEQAAFWRQQGVRPIIADLDCAASLKRIAGVAGAVNIVLHFAPPQNQDSVDLRTRRLLAALCRGESLPQRIIYVSTSGVYGDCGGAPVPETRPLRPATARGKRRQDAERQLRRFGRDHGVNVSLLRAPGIYAADRLPIERLQKSTPALSAEDDVFTNHIHADDLAMLVCATIRRGRPNRCYNAADDSGMKMGEYFDLVADALGLPRPPRISRQNAEAELSPVQLSFMSESRRLDNRRIKQELFARLRYPRVSDCLAEIVARQERKPNGLS